MKTSFRPIAGLLCISLVVRLAYLWLRPASAVSDDVHGWIGVIDQLRRGLNPYTSSYLNWPPLWLGVLWCLDHVARGLGVGFASVLFAFLLLVESLEILLLLLIAQRISIASSRSISLAILVGIALNPAAIFQTTQHGNFDNLVALWILLSVSAFVTFEATNRPRDWLTGCMWVGIAALTKTSPLILFPLAVIGMRRVRLLQRVAGIALIVLPIAIALAILYQTSPRDVWMNVIAYRSSGGYFGLSGLLSQSTLGEHAIPYLAPAFAIIIATILCTLSIRLWRVEQFESRRILLIAAMLMLSIPTLGPGYGAQYICWHLPLLVLGYVAFDDPAWRRLLCFGWLVAAATYLFEYSFVRSQGAVLVHAFPRTMWIQNLSLIWSDRVGQTTVRLPIFAASLAILIRGTTLCCAKTRIRNGDGGTVAAETMRSI